MPMVRINERQAEFAGLGDLPDEIGFASGVNANVRSEIGGQLGNLKTDETGRVDAAVGVTINRVDGNPGLRSVLVTNRGGDNGRGKSGQRTDLDYAPRREDANQAGEEKIIAGPDA